MDIINKDALSKINGGSPYIVGLKIAKVLITGVMIYGFGKWREERQFVQDQAAHELNLKREEELALKRKETLNNQIS